MIGKVLEIVASTIKRGSALKKVHVSQGIDDSIFVYNKFTLPETNLAVQQFQSDIDEAFEALAIAVPQKIIDVIGDEQFTTTVEISKEAVKVNPFPASLQSLAHRTNLTDAYLESETYKQSVIDSEDGIGKGFVWVADAKGTAAVGNKAVGLSMDSED